MTHKMGACINTSALSFMVSSEFCTNHEFNLKVRGVKLRRRRPLNPIKAASFMILAESNAVTTRKPKKLPAIVDHDQLLRCKGSKATSADPMVKCMRELKDLRKARKVRGKG